MFDLKIFMPEFSLLVTIIILSFFLIDKNSTKSNNKQILDVIFYTGVFISGFWLLIQFFYEPLINYKLLVFRDQLSTIFKFYFLYAAVYFVSNYSSRYHAMERILILSLLLAVFFLFTSISKLLSFISFSLIIISCYGFMLTRFRPSKDIVLLASLMLLLSLLYQTFIPIPLIMMIIISIILIHYTNDKSIEGLLVYFAVPIMVYLIVRFSEIAGTNLIFFSVLRVIGLSLITISILLLFSSARDWKRNVKYGLFYIGHIIFMLGINTIETKILTLIMVFLIPVVYSKAFNFFSVCNLSMLPPSPLFLIKLSLLTIIFNTGSLTEKIILSLSSFFFALYSSIDISKNFNQPQLKITIGKKILKYAAMVFVFFCLVYFDGIKEVLKTTILNMMGNTQV